MSNILTYVFSIFLLNLKNLNKLGSSIFWFVYCLFYDFWNLSLSGLDKSRGNLKKLNQNIFYNYNNYKLKLNFINFFKNQDFLNYDVLWLKLFSFNYELKSYKISIYRSYFRVFNTKNGFYFNFKNLNNSKNLFFMLKFSFLGGLKYLWLGLRFWFFPLVLCFGIIYTSLVLKLLPFNKIIFSWIVITMFIYWLISGFVFFLKSINLVNIQHLSKDFEEEVTYYSDLLKVQHF